MPRDRKPSRNRIDLPDLLAGRGAPKSARELIALIHEANPTGLGLSAAETERRYALKSRLQSMLIRGFPEEIDVQPEPLQPGIVSLRYGPLHDDACHALVDALDEDARSWVKYQIDLGAPAASERAPSSAQRAPAPRGPALSGEGGTAESLIEAGREALHAYDYEQARVCFAGACDRSSGGVEAALPLLALFVEQLAADQEALSLASSLPPATLKNVEVRALLALACARSGEREQALRYTKDLEGARALAVMLALCRAAVEAGDLEGAARDLANARRLDPAHAELKGVSELIAARRARERLPLEEEAARLLGEGLLDEAEGQARALLARFPESAAGQRVIRAVEEQRRAALAGALIASADEALARGEAAAAAALLRQALGAGPSGPEAARARERLVEIEAMERARALRAEEDGVAKLLQESDPAPGLVAYLALDPRRRGSVRQRAAMPALGWIDELALPATPSARARAVAGAVLALGRAEARVAADPEGALSLLEAHGKVLHGHRRNEEIAAEARRRLDAIRRDAAARRLGAARDAEAEGRIDEARALLAEIAPGDLEPGDRAAAAELRARVERVIEERRLSVTHDRLLREGAVLRARSTAEQLLARATGEGRARWAAAHEAAQAAVQRAFRVHVDRSPRPVAALRDVDVNKLPGDLRQATGELVVAEAHGPWIFIRLLELDARETRARVVMRAPARLDLLSTQIEGDHAFLVGCNGVVLEIALSSFAVRDWYEIGKLGIDATVKTAVLNDGKGHHAIVLPSYVASGEVLEQAVLAPRSRVLWVQGFSGTRGYFVRLIDLDQKRMLREMPSKSAVYVRPVPDLSAPCVALFWHHDEIVTLHDPHGAPLERGRIERPGLASTIVPYPGRDLLFMLTGGRPIGHGKERTPIRWCTVTLAGEASEEQALDELAGMEGCGVSTDPDTGMVFLHWNRKGEPPEFLGLRASLSGAPALERVFRIGAPARCWVMSAVQGHGMRVLSSYDDGFDVATLGTAPPEFRTTEAAGRFPAARAGLLVTRCYRPTGARWEGIKALASTIKSESPAARERRIRAVEAKNDPDRMMELAHALEWMGDPGGSGALGLRVLQRHPGHAESRVAHARALANADCWDEVRDLLISIDSSKLDEGTAKHCHHLLGLALLGLGEPEEAERVLAKGAAYEGGRCDLSLPIALSTPLPDSPAEEAAKVWSADQRVLRTLLTVIHDADLCLARGDAAGARRVLDRLAVTESREVQSLARLAEAWLSVKPADEGERFDAALALAAFCAVHAEREFMFRREMLLPRGKWDSARLDDLAARAERWLDATFGEAMPAPPGGL